MDAKERARRFKQHQELVSKVVKQQEDIKKKRRQKLTGEEAFERKQEKFFKSLKNFPRKNYRCFHSSHNRIYLKHRQFASGRREEKCRKRRNGEAKEEKAQSPELY